MLAELRLILDIKAVVQTSPGHIYCTVQGFVEQKQVFCLKMKEMRIILLSLSEILSTKMCIT